MTVRDLLTNTSGLSYGIMERTHLDAAYRKLRIGDGQGTLSDLVEKLGQLPLEFSPGSRWGYSVATDVIARLVEILSGRRFEDYLREEIFEPLRMVDTGYTVAADKLPRFAANYARSPDGGMTLFDDPADSAYARPKTLFTGSSGPHLHGGGLRAVRRDAPARRSDRRREAPRPADGPLHDDEPPPGRGRPREPRRWSRRSARRATRGSALASGSTSSSTPCARQVPGSAGEYGWGGMASTAFWVDPAEELTVVFMTQLVPSSALNVRAELKSIVYGAIVD